MTGSVPENAELALRLVREAPVIAYDTETSGVDWKRNYPVGYVIGTGYPNTFYVPVRHGGGGNLPDPSVRPLDGPLAAPGTYPVHRWEQELARAFKDRERLGLLTVGHHMKFDVHMSANAGIYMGRHLACTQNNEALLDEYAKRYSLEESAKRRKVTAKRGSELYEHLANLFGGAADRKAMENFWQTTGDDPVVMDYTIGDGISTFELFDVQRALLAEEELDTVFRLESDLIWTLFRMERRGIRVDEEYLGKTAEYIAGQVEEARQRLPPDFNERSPIDVRAYVEGAGRTDWPTTELGNPSFTERWLKTFPEGQNIVKVRKWTNLLNSFITPLIEKHVWNGRVHATLNQLKTDDMGTAARLSCSSPNLQAVPKRDKELAQLFRQAFLPDEGFEMFEDDYSQCEPRLFAHYAKEPALIEGYCQTPFRDAHQVVADMLQVERDPTAKRMNMGIFTGMYPKTFAEHMNWPLDRATNAWEAWHAAFPAIRDFQDAAKNRILDMGFVRTLLGRRGRLEHPRFAYRGVSKIIQGGNADIVKYKMVEIDKWLEAEHDNEAMLLMTIHDAFEGQFLKGKEAVHKQMLEMMVDVQGPPFKLRVPFVVDSGTGRNWAIATFGESKDGKVSKDEKDGGKTGRAKAALKQRTSK